MERRGTTYRSRAVRFSSTLIGGTDERLILSPRVILLSFGVCFAGEGVAEGATDEEVDSLAAGSDSELGSSEDDAPLPNRPLSFPAPWRHVRKLPIRFQGKVSPAREPSLISPKAIASCTVTKPDSERTTVAFITGSGAPSSVKF